MDKKTRKPATKRTKTTTPKPVPTRRKYEADTKEEAKDLYTRGLTLDRIAKYLGVPVRTLTNWQTEDRWKDAKDPAAAALDLRERGYPVAKIAERLEVSERTVRKWMKAATV